LVTILTGFLGGYQTLRPRLTKYCRGRVPGIPGGVDAYDEVYEVTSREGTIARHVVDVGIIDSKSIVSVFKV